MPRRRRQFHASPVRAFLISAFRVMACLALLAVARPAPAQPAPDRPEEPEVGPSRILPGQPYLGRFDAYEYRNWGEVNYPRLVGVTSNLRSQYSILGDPLVYGSQSVRWVERRGLGVRRYPGVGSGSELVERSPHGEAGTSFSRLFNYVIVGTDGTDSWKSRFIFADEIRTRLTPLTFKMSNLNGLRVDVGTANDGLSLMFSRLNAPIFSSGFGGNQSIMTNALLFGAHYERKVGFMNFGTTFVNAHQVEPLMGESALSYKGVPGAIQGSPALLAVRISDDSPTDGEGPVLHGVRVLINGEVRDDLQPFIVRQSKRGGDRQSYVAGLLRSGERRPLPPLKNDYQTLNRGGSYNTYDPYINYALFDVDVYYRGYDFPFWIDHLYYRDFSLHGPDHVINPDHGPLETDVVVHEEFAHELVEASGDFAFATVNDLPQSFDGNEYGILYVDLESVVDVIQSVEIELAVANDYRVELSEIDMAGSSESGPRGDYRDKYRYASYFRTVARAEGNPKDGSIRRVVVDAGVPTGLNLYSANAHGVYKGFKITAEFSRRRSFYQYASGRPLPRVALESISINALRREQNPGARSDLSDDAWYLTVERDFERFSFGTEVFSIGPLYTTELRTYIGRDERDTSGNPIAFNNTMIHRLVEDNDDDDRYPDSWYNNAPSDLQGQSDVDGIFPGLDEDGDGIPDTNRDFDATPDHLEPFLMYTADPQIYDYGLDLNHNDFIDRRENDIEPDLPYERDLSGAHLYGSAKLSEGLFFTLGLMRGEQVAGAAPNNFTYGRLSLRRSEPRLGDFFAVASVERVEDGVPDSLSTFSDRVLTVAEQFDLDFAGLQRNIQIAPFLEVERPDPMLFLNSTWYRFFTDTRWALGPQWHMRNKVKFEINDQREGDLFDGTFQQGDRRHRWTMVHMMDRTWELTERWHLFAGYKMRYRREWQESVDGATVHQRDSIPIAKLEYRLTERTRFQLGVQGLGGWAPYSVTDLVNPEVNFEQNDAVLMATNNSEYFGYVVTTNVGLSKRTKSFDDDVMAEIGDEDFVSAFIKVFIGFRDE
jgi:hypothetical protein